MTKPEFERLKAKTDVAQVFLVFMSLIGDVDKTAAALDLDPAFVQGLADECEWQAKVRRISVMSKSEKPGDWERAQNRALNFVQAHRSRMVLDKILKDLEDSPSLMERLSQTTRDGNTNYSCRFMADLLAAIEKSQALSYHALGDTTTERMGRIDAGEGDISANDLHAALVAALNDAAAPSADKLIAEQEKVTQVLAPAENAQVSERSPSEVSAHSPARPNA